MHFIMTQLSYVLPADRCPVPSHGKYSIILKSPGQARTDRGLPGAGIGSLLQNYLLYSVFIIFFTLKKAGLG